MKWFSNADFSPNGNIDWGIDGNLESKNDPKIMNEYQTFRDIMLRKLKDAFQRYRSGQLRAVE
jgi:hypothetical protein